MRDLYKNAFATAALDIAVCGWQQSKVPDNLKDWCARDLCTRLPDNVIKELFTRLGKLEKSKAHFRIFFADFTHDINSLK